MGSTTRLLAVCLIGLATAGQALPASLHFVDSPSRAFLRPAGQSPPGLSAAELSAALGSLLSIESSQQPLSAASAAKVGQGGLISRLRLR